MLFGHAHRSYTLSIPELDAVLLNAGSTTLTGREGLWLFDVDEGTVEVRRGKWSEGHYVVKEPRLPPAEGF